MSRHTPVGRLESALYFTSNFTRPRRAVESNEVNANGEAPKKIVYREASTKKPSAFAHFSSIAPRGPLPATEDHESPRSSHPSSIGEAEQAYTNLPLLNVSVEVHVEGFIAHTTLVQRFHNPSDETITQARYTFPLYDGAVVTSFYCNIGTQRVLQGKVEPKKEARRKYKEAVKKKEVAALLEEHTPEIFETVVGNIPAKTAVQVNITYVNELKAATGELQTEGLGVILPTSIAPRYSRGPKKYRADNNLTNDGLDITITVHDDDGHVKDIISESGHNIVLEAKAVARPPRVITDLDDLGEEDPQASTDVNILQATYHSPTPVLQGDFVVIIQMRESWPLRSRAALSITDKHGHAALMVNIKPSEVFSSVVQKKPFDGEIVFLVDQSGSMDGSKIKTLRPALSLALTSLPADCAVNIVSFGSHAQFRWLTSQKNSTEILTSAKNYVSSIRADMGGTELLFALQEVVESRLQDRSSMQIIVITDGEVEPETIIRYVWQTRQELGDRVRFFALGIGDQVSHQFIECIGEFGGGYGETVDIQKVPKWSKKLIRMLKGTMMPNNWSCDIDLGPRFERQNSITYDLGEPSSQAQDRIPYIQAPFPTPSLHPFRYQALYFLVDMRAFDERLRKQGFLREIILRPHGGADMVSEFLLPVDISSRLTDSIHQLTAKAILGQLEAELDSRPSVSEAQRDLAQVNGEYLGTTYSVTGKWTSFVAVDNVTQEADEIDFYKANIKDPDLTDDLSEHLSERDLEMGGLAVLNTAFEFTDLEHTFDEAACAPRLGAQILRGRAFPAHDYGTISLPRRPRQTLEMSPNRPRTLRKRFMLPTRLLSRIRHFGLEGSSTSSSSVASESLFAGCAAAAPDGSPCLTQTVQELSSYFNDVDDPILLQNAVDTQDVNGIFGVDEPLRERLELHFCPKTLETLVNAISNAIASETLATVKKIKALAYTMMFVQYIQTHLAQDQELWDLMVQKARIGVKQALTVKDDSLLVSLDQLLEKASMHAHFRPTVDWSQVGQLVSFPPTSAGEACPVCGKACDKILASSFECRFPACNDLIDLSSGWSSWDDLWRHQIENGHLVCHQKKSQPLIRNERTQEKERKEKGEMAPAQAQQDKRQQQAKRRRSFWDIVLRRSR